MKTERISSDISKKNMKELYDELDDILLQLPDISNKEVYIWGSGNTALKYQEGIIRIPNFKIKAYVDSNYSKQGQMISGKIIISPSEIEISEKTVILICTTQKTVLQEIISLCKKMEIKESAIFHIDAGIWGMYKREIRELFDVLSDEKSKYIYLQMLKNRISCTLPTDDVIDRNQYFSLSEFAKISEKEIFMDCGAFVGDTIEKYIWSRDGVFNKIIAFEPDNKNIEGMKYRLDRLKKEWNISENKIEVYPYAVSDRKNVAYIKRCEVNNGLGTITCADKNDLCEEVKSIRVDDFIREGNVFLKADIEGYEYRLIIGAENSIKKYQPKMAICIYHNAVDFFSIPLLIKKINPKYRLFIRHHSVSLDETVLYAYV